jgi:VanZ family protein
MTSNEPPKPNAFNWWTLLLVVYWLGLVISTHAPLPAVEPPVTQLDKLAHFLMYGSLAWLLAMAWQSSTGRLNRRHLQFVWLAVTLFASADELTQTPFGRDASLWDLLADAVGAATGIYLFTVTRRLFEIN